MSVIDEYLAKVDEPQKAELERIRQLVRATVPEAQEVITYGMPGFKYKGKYLVAFASFKDHLSLFPGGVPVETLKHQLEGFKISTGTIQFTLDNPLPVSLVKEILRLRLATIDSK